ncbi:MAG: hypothetical protein V1892_00920 [bacterium]
MEKIYQVEGKFNIYKRGEIEIRGYHWEGEITVIPKGNVIDEAIAQLERKFFEEHGEEVKIEAEAYNVYEIVKAG